MTPPAPPRPARRATTQLLVGLLPLVVVGLVLAVVLAVRLSSAREPVAAATGSATATVVADGLAPGGRGVSVTFPDAQGRQRTGVVVQQSAAPIDPGTTLTVRYDPTTPIAATAVFASGDATDAAVVDLLFGLAVTVLVVVGAAVLTGARVLARRRLRRAPAGEAVATRVVVRRGLVVRSWLELATGNGVRWVPVHWSPELAALEPDSPIEVRGNAATGRAALPVVAGAEVWPSGRLRSRAPRGERQVVVPADLPDARVTWGRQLRSDVLVVLAAPVLGLLWAFVDSSGGAGFAVATVLAAAVLFWLAELLGSDPAPPPREP